MEQARREQVKIIERERQRKDFYEQQRKYINNYKVLKKKTDDLLMMPGGGFSQNNDALNSFYERQQNFGFPITTTHDGGIMSQFKQNPNALEKLNADIKAG